MGFWCLWFERIVLKKKELYNPHTHDPNALPKLQSNSSWTSNHHRQLCQRFDSECVHVRLSFTPCVRTSSCPLVRLSYWESNPSLEPCVCLCVGSNALKCFFRKTSYTLQFALNPTWMWPGPPFDCGLSTPVLRTQNSGLSILPAA